jgi:hypothetical protein
MPHFIKAGFWEKAERGFKSWLNLDNIITSVAGSISSPTSTLTDEPTVDVSTANSTLTTSSATQTIDVSYPGDDSTLVVILNTTDAVLTFPPGSLTVSEGVASGDNTLTLSGVSGDHYVIGIKKIGDVHYVVSKNFGQ